MAVLGDWVVSIGSGPAERSAHSESWGTVARWRVGA